MLYAHANTRPSHGTSWRGRDRAAERRKQEDGDYSAVGEYSAVPAQPDMLNISIEESKFLGGDLEHTHLVKGLDFALLQKVRAFLKYLAGDGAVVAPPPCDEGPMALK